MSGFKSIDDVLAATMELPPYASPGDYLDEDGLLRCGTCHRQKELDVEFRGRTFRVGCMCKCEEDEWARREERQKRPAARNSDTCGLPVGIILPDTGKATFDVADKVIGRANIKRAHRYAEDFAQMKERNVGLLIFGPPSCGKSLLAFAIGNQVRSEGFTVLITSMSRALNEICDVRGSSRNGLIDQICRRDLLVIDDLGAERDTGYTREQALSLIDTRYRSQLPLIVTTNLGLKPMREETDVERQRIYARILEVCRPMTLPARDLRAEAAKANQQQALELFR